MIQKYRNYIIAAIALLIIGGISLYVYSNDVKTKAMEQMAKTPSEQEIKEISEAIWQQYKAEQAELEAQGIQETAAEEPVVIQDYFIESLREVLPVGANKAAIDDLIALDDPCIKADTTQTTESLLVYTCTMSPRYPQGTIRRAVMQDGKLVDYYIEDRPGIHTGKPYESPASE